ncbi:MAG TPA: ComF family protein [Chloroflexota bacterium]|nr:ComF family protein [Chloroflexota bacterium]
MHWFADLFYPRRCVACGVRGEWLCRDCRDALPRLPDERCRHCAVPLRSVAVCPACWQEAPPFDSMTCGFLFGGALRAAVHQLKYRNGRHLAEPLVDALLAVASVPGDLDALVPIPLHHSRMRRRGYNQSELLARAISEKVGVLVRSPLLTRVRDTPTQTTLPAVERWQNVRGAFQADPAAKGSRLLLIDDVATTTGTLRAAASALKDVGASAVHALVLARVP